MDTVGNLVLSSRRESSQKQFLNDFKEKAPPMSSCFNFGKRPLNGMSWISGVSVNKLDNWLNTELVHEHGFFPATGENLGFGPRGVFVENSSKFSYQMDKECYDGNVMREAIASLGELGEYVGFWNPLKGFYKNNCQDFADKLRVRYQEILGKL